MSRPHLVFVTGKLAAPSLQRIVADLAGRAGFDFSVVVLPISVVALATTPWIARHLQLPQGARRVVLPGLCQGPLDVLGEAHGPVQFERGPEDLRDLPEFFGSAADPHPGYGKYDLEILAEINHAGRLPPAEVLTQARSLHDDGADIIDLGCDPGEAWAGLADAVRMLRAEGLRVSLDTFDPREAEAGARAGVELILSVNGGNVARAKDWGCAVVAIPDDPATLGGLTETVSQLEADGVPYRLDPVLEPIGFGFAASLGRYLETRRRFPRAEMLMGTGNLSELTDADSAGINVLLAGFCQEAGIRSVLTTQVINWARSSVKELDLARRLVHYACTHKTLPKRLEPNLILLRDARLRQHGPEGLAGLARQIRDRNFRLFAEDGALHVINGTMHLEGTDPFALFKEMLAREGIDPAHAFYLGYEMAKAVTALTLAKNYVQDEALHWGFLTRPEKSSRHDP